MKPEWKVFFPNEEENPFSLLIDSFLQRQVYLDASISVVLQLPNKAELSFSHMFDDLEGYHVLHHYTHEIDHSTDLEYRKLKNLIYMNLLAQSVENFESLLKQLIQILQKRQQVKMTWATLIRKILKRRGSYKELRSNRERIKFLKRALPKLSAILTKSEYSQLYELFLVIEKVRHLTIHSQMTINDNKAQEIYNTKYFKTYFKVETISGKDIVFTNVEAAQQLTRQISTLGYIIFQSVSNEYKLPISVGRI